MGYKPLVQDPYTNRLKFDERSQMFLYEEGIFANGGYEFHRTRIRNMKTYTIPMEGILNSLGNKQWYVLEVEISDYAPCIMRWKSQHTANSVYNILLTAKKEDVFFQD